MAANSLGRLVAFRRIGNGSKSLGTFERRYVMRKSGWAVAAALGSLALLLAGCGGSSSSNGGASTTPTANGRPSSDIGVFSPGDTVLIVQQSNLGYVLALANGDVVYTYGNDKKGGQPSLERSTIMTRVPGGGEDSEPEG